MEFRDMLSDYIVKNYDEVNKDNFGDVEYQWYAEHDCIIDETTDEWRKEDHTKCLKKIIIDNAEKAKKYLKPSEVIKGLK